VDEVRGNLSRENEIHPIEALNRLLQRWHVVLLGAVIGAVFGSAFSLLVPPHYEAVAAFAVSIEYGRTKPLELVVEDRVLDRVWQLVHAPDILEGYGRKAAGRTWAG
jgi:capsular polysaccharide biosynthesis protein